MNGQTDERTDGRTDERTDGRTNGRTDGVGQTNGRTNGKKDGKKDGRKEGRTDVGRIGRYRQKAGFAGNTYMKRPMAQHGGILMERDHRVRN